MAGEGSHLVRGCAGGAHAHDDVARGDVVVRNHVRPLHTAGHRGVHHHRAHQVAQVRSLSSCVTSKTIHSQEPRTQPPRRRVRILSKLRFGVAKGVRSCGRWCARIRDALMACAASRLCGLLPQAGVGDCRGATREERTCARAFCTAFLEGTRQTNQPTHLQPVSRSFAPQLCRLQGLWHCKRTVRWSVSGGWKGVGVIRGGLLFELQYCKFTQ